MCSLAVSGCLACHTACIQAWIHTCMHVLHMQAQPPLIHSQTHRSPSSPALSL